MATQDDLQSKLGKFTFTLKFSVHHRLGVFQRVRWVLSVIRVRLLQRRVPSAGRQFLPIYHQENLLQLQNVPPLFLPQMKWMWIRPRTKMVNAALGGRLQGWETAMLIQGPMETSSKGCSYSLINVWLRAKEHMIKATKNKLVICWCFSKMFKYYFCMQFLSANAPAASNSSIFCLTWTINTTLRIKSASVCHFLLLDECEPDLQLQWWPVLGKPKLNCRLHKKVGGENCLGWFLYVKKSLLAEGVEFL